MKFAILANLFETLENTSKRLEKILILKEFYNSNPEVSPLVFDIIAGNYQRKIDKKTLGISLKTIFAVLSFITKTPVEEIEKKFNKLGDLGIIAEELTKKALQSSLKTKESTLTEITQTLSQISLKTGKDSNKYKRELLSKLFLNLKTPTESKYLARLLIDDLRIGVSEGTLLESYTNAIFPPIIGIHTINNEQKITFEVLHKDKTELEKIEKNKIMSQQEIDKKKLYEHLFKREFLEPENPREIYNMFCETIENKYNLLNSFEDLDRLLKKDKTNILKAEIILGNPIKSMLGTRVKSVEEAIEVTGDKILADYKYDGLRIQIHNNKGNITLYSRNLEDVTKQFPEIIEFIKENFGDISFVLDSECVGYDYEKHKFLPFQLLSKRILSKEIEEVSHINICVKVFDILFLNGETLISYSYEKRREILENLFLNRDLKQKKYFNERKLN